MSMLNDECIRTALKQQLLLRYSKDHDTLVLEELGLRHGSARVDIAIINGSLDGIEIKSDCDSLYRLPNQMRIYNSVLDHVLLVVGHRFLNDVISLVPDWWGIQLAETTPMGDVHFSTIRESSSNPASDILAVTKLLWRHEALTLLEEIGAIKGFRQKPRAAIYAHLAETADSEWLRARIRSQLRSRKDWRSDLPQM